MLIPSGKMGSTSTLKSVHDITFGDEFDCLYGRYSKRVRAVSLPYSQGNHVSLRVQPVCQRGTCCTIEFVDSAVLSIYSYRTPTRKSRLQQSEDIVYSTLSKRQNTPRCSLVDIAYWIEQSEQTSLPLSRLRTACNRLAIRGLLTRWHQGTMYYRLPLDFYLGMPLVEHSGHSTRQRFGWVKEIKPLWSSHQEVKERPIVQWLDGTVGASLDEWLDPVVDFRALKAIERDRQMRTEGLNDNPPRIIPWHLLVGIVSPAGLVGGRRLLEVSKFLGFTTKQRLSTEERNKTLDYLDRYYPGWRKTYREFPISC